MHGKILMGENLEKRGRILLNSCYACKGDLESVGRLLVPCQFTRAFWERTFFCLGFFCVSSKSIANHLLAWEGYCGRKVKKKASLVFPHVIFWTIWR